MLNPSHINGELYFWCGFVENKRWTQRSVEVQTKTSVNISSSSFNTSQYWTKQLSIPKNHVTERVNISRNQTYKSTHFIHYHAETMAAQQAHFLPDPDPDLDPDPVTFCLCHCRSVTFSPRPGGQRPNGPISSCPGARLQPWTREQDSTSPCNSPHRSPIASSRRRLHILWGTSCRFFCLFVF